VYKLSGWSELDGWRGVHDVCSRYVFDGWRGVHDVFSRYILYSRK
jgi:hypothetical protein